MSCGGKKSYAELTKKKKKKRREMMMGTRKESGNSRFEYSFKILLIGDSGVGKSSLLLTFISHFSQNLSPTIGMLLCFITHLNSVSNSQHTYVF